MENLPGNTTQSLRNSALSVIPLCLKPVYLNMTETSIYLAWNKPIDREPIAPIDPSIPPSLKPIAALGVEDEGLVLFTDDPKAVLREQECEVTISEPLSKEAIHIINKGMLVQGEFYSGLTISRLSNRGKRSIVSVISEDDSHGRIRLMFASLGHPPLSLRCIRINGRSLGTLSPGQWKFIKKQDAI